MKAEGVKDAMDLSKVVSDLATDTSTVTYSDSVAVLVRLRNEDLEGVNPGHGLFEELCSVSCLLGDQNNPFSWFVGRSGCADTLVGS